MKRALFSQIKNDWRENIWLIVELLIVSLVVLYLTITLIRSYKDSCIPLGTDITGVYGASIDFLDITGESYNFVSTNELEPEVMDRLVKEQQALLDRVRELPMVEYAALGNNILPYNYNFIGNSLQYKDGKDTILYYVNHRVMTPEGVQVLHLESRTGKTMKQMKEMLEKGDLLVGSPLSLDMNLQNYGLKLENVIGAKIIGNFNNHRAADLITTIRRTVYEPHNYYGMVIEPIQENTPDILHAYTLMVRIKPGREKDFEMAMQDEPAFKTTSGVVLSNLRPLTEDKLRTSWKTEVQQRAYIGGIIFLLAIIFIGLLGTFWYRVYLRIPEIAIRKTFGATDVDIFRRFLTEALILLLIAFILAAGLYFTFIDELKEGLLDFIILFNSWKWDMALAALITASVMTLMIIVGVGIPARQAMKIDPASALKEE